MNKFAIERHGYLFNVKCKGFYCAPRCSLPRERVTPRIRGPSTIWFDYNQQIIKEINYPCSLWNKIEPDDPIENFILELTWYLPDWEKIDIIKENL